MSELADRRITIRLTESEHLRLIELAFLHDRTVAWEMRRALRAYLRSQEMSANVSQRQTLAAPAA